MPYTAFAERLLAIDLHYHAGVERPAGVTLQDYLQHAWDTGRRCQGITDHIDLYVSDRPLAEDHRAYPTGVDGLRQLYQEMTRLREKFPKMRLFFAPEYHTEYFADGAVRLPFEDLRGEIVEMADYIICDVSVKTFVPLGLDALTAAQVRVVEDISRLGQRTGKPVFYAHPLRGAIDRTISKYAHPTAADVARSDRAEAIFAAGGELSPADLDEFFQVHLRQLGRAAQCSGVPLEINGMSQNRIRAKRPGLYPAYLQACRTLAEAGATFVLGSDQHNVPDYDKVAERANPFALLGPRVIDRAFLTRIGIQLDGA